MAAPATRLSAALHQPRQRDPVTQEMAARPSRRSTGRTARRSVALWVAAAKAVKTNSAHFSSAVILSACVDQDEQRRAPRARRRCRSAACWRAMAGRWSGSATGRSRAAGAAGARPSTRRVSCRIQSVASAWTTEIDPEIGALADMKVEPEHGRAARHQIAFVPARQIAAGVPLQQRIAVPQGRRDQEQGNDDDGDPDRTGLGRACGQGFACC